MVYRDQLVTAEFQYVISDGGGVVYIDLVAVANSANLNMRQLSLPDMQPQYSGRVDWPGTVPEDVSEEARELFAKHYNAFTWGRGYVVGQADSIFP